jgi:trimethylguanosine synthase
MGKRKVRKFSHSRNSRRPKRQKKGRFWIEDCCEIAPPSGKEAAFVITISRCELEDKHTFRHGDHDSCDTQGNDLCKTEESITTQIQADAIPDDSACASLFSGKADTPHITNPEQPKELEPIVPAEEAFIQIRRALSALKPMKEYPHQNFKELSSGDCGDGEINPNDSSEVPDKYWAQRKRFFSKFDDGIILDKEGWFSVTPEAIANHIANRLTSGQGKDSMVVLDAFSGCGGNTIAFAQREEISLVISVDCDRQKLKLAANNAAVYKIPPRKILFIHANAFDIISQFQGGSRKPLNSSLNTVDRIDDQEYGYRLGDLQSLPERLDAVFLSPPWGGMDYQNFGRRNYHVGVCIEIFKSDGSSWNGEQILKDTSAACKGPIVYFLPRNVNGLSLGRMALTAKHRSLELEQNFLKGKLKTVSAYFNIKG